MADRAALQAALAGIARLDPALLLSAHLPPAFAMADSLAGLVADLHCGGPAVAPDGDLLARLAA